MSSDLSKFNQPLLIELSFSEVEMCLADVHQIRTDRRGAFTARIKNLLKLGLLPDVQAGRGRAASYAAWDLFVIAVAIELAQLGLSPDRAVNAIRANQKSLAAGIYLAAHGLLSEYEEAILFYFDPASLEDMMKQAPKGDRTASDFLCGPVSQLKQHLEDHGAKSLSRLAMFNATILLRSLLANGIASDDQASFLEELRDMAMFGFRTRSDDGDT